MAEELLHACQRRHAMQAHARAPDHITQATKVIVQQVKEEWAQRGGRDLDAAPEVVRTAWQHATGRRQRRRRAAQPEPEKRSCKHPLGNPRNLYLKLHREFLAARGMSKRAAMDVARKAWDASPQICKKLLVRSRTSAFAPFVPPAPAASADPAQDRQDLGDSQWPLREEVLRRFISSRDSPAAAGPTGAAAAAGPTDGARRRSILRDFHESLRWEVQQVKTSASPPIKEEQTCAALHFGCCRADTAASLWRTALHTLGKDGSDGFCLRHPGQGVSLCFLHVRVTLVYKNQWVCILCANSFREEGASSIQDLAQTFGAALPPVLKRQGAPRRQGCQGVPVQRRPHYTLVWLCCKMPAAMALGPGVATCQAPWPCGAMGNWQKRSRRSTPHLRVGVCGG